MRRSPSTTRSTRPVSHKKQAPVRQTRRHQHKQAKKHAKLAAPTAAAAFAQSRPTRGFWDTPADPNENYKDFFHVRPQKNVLGTIVQALRNRYLIQVGNPQFFDRDYELRLALGPEQFEQHLKRVRDNDYGGFKGFDELDFHTSYYKRVSMIPKSVGQEEEALLLDENQTFWRSTPGHLLRPHNEYQEQYIDFRYQTGKLGIATLGSDYNPRTDFEFPRISIDADYLFFHE